MTTFQVVSIQLSTKKYYRTISPFILIFLGILTTVYFVNNPGGELAARLLNYQGIFRALFQHISLVFIALTCAIAFSVTLGIIITRPSFRRIVPIIDSSVSIAQTVPGLAVLALFYTILGLGFKTAIFALWLYSLLPILRNTSAGIQTIPADIIESARGMGMTPLHILIRVELPLALPIMMAGIRASAVICTGSAALSTFVGAGGLGDLIVTGLALRRDTLLFTGGILTALLGIFVDNIFGNLERYILKRT